MSGNNAAARATEQSDDARLALLLANAIAAAVYGPRGERRTKTHDTPKETA